MNSCGYSRKRCLSTIRRSTGAHVICDATAADVRRLLRMCTSVVVCRTSTVAVRTGKEQQYILHPERKTKVPRIRGTTFSHGLRIRRGGLAIVTAAQRLAAGMYAYRRLAEVPPPPTAPAPFFFFSSKIPLPLSPSLSPLATNLASCNNTSAWQSSNSWSARSPGTFEGGRHSSPQPSAFGWVEPSCAGGGALVRTR